MKRTSFPGVNSDSLDDEALIDDQPLDYFIKPNIPTRSAAPSLKGTKLSEIVTVNKPGRRFWKAVQLTLAGQTTVGIIGREIKNVIKHFIPFGKYADAALDVVGDSLKKENIMEQEKPKSKSKTVITFGLLFLVGLLQLLGLDIGLELSQDAQWLSAGVGIAGVILRLVTDKPIKLGSTLKTILGKS